jgi:hypothetical protein
MITRKQYLDASLQDQPAMHRAYYGEIARECHVRVPPNIVEKSRKALADGDTHLNTIPLRLWDGMVQHLRGVSAALKERGDYLTLGNGVCVLKEAAKLQVEGEL